MKYKLFPQQPPAFEMIFFMEFWERFGFYTIQGILILYFIRHLSYTELQAYYIFGSFSAIVYSLVLIGGFLGDKILGTKRTIVLGLTVLVLAYFSLAISDKESVFFSLGLICVGNGLFKANPANLLSKCYEKDDPRLHSGYTLYYMAVNLGSIFALIIGPWVSSRYSYALAYLISSAGLILALANYFFQRQRIAHIHTKADQRFIPIWLWFSILLVIALVAHISAFLLQHITIAKNAFWFITVVAIISYVQVMRQVAKKEAVKMAVALILMLLAVIFFTLYQQMPTSLNLFAVNQVHAHFFGIGFDPQSFQALNPIWIVLMSPLLAFFYNFLNKKGIPFGIAYKFACGMSLAGFSFLILYFARFYYTGSGIVSSWWLVISYLFQSLGELMVSALGVAMIAELVPPFFTGSAMGIWFLTTAASGFIGAWVASYTAIPANTHPGVESLMIYTHVFAWIGIITLIISLCMWLIARRLTRYI